MHWQPAQRVVLIRPLLLLLLAGCGGSGVSSPGEIEALLAAGEVAAADREVKAALQRNPEDAELRLLRAQIHLAQQDGAAAYAAFERARTLGAEGPELLGGMAESLMLQRRYVDAVRLLASPASAEALDLLRLRLAARLRVPLARPDELFGDAREWLARAPREAATGLEALASQPGVLADNAAHVRRALAYWSCQQPAPESEAPMRDGFAVYEPAWANLEEDGRRILRVGPAEALKTPGAAARVARDGDIVVIAAGTYRGDVATWDANGLWLRADGGDVVLDSGGATAGNMGIWVVRGDNVLVDGIRFTGARSTDKNGSGIRFLGHNLWVRNSGFHDNEDGLLTAGRDDSEILVERSTFKSNGASDGYSHNVYVGREARLIFRFNYSAGAKIGHQLKSRAFENYILYNRLTDGTEGDSSYTIDLSEGGFALILGNELQQGPRTVNRHMISLGAEDRQDREHRFIFAYNTFYNHTSPATFIRDATDAGIALVNNAFAGAPANLDAMVTTRTGNAFDASPGLRDGGSGDFGLEPSATFIDSADPRATLDDTPILPQFEYVHPADARPRTLVWRPDPGAHEFCGWPAGPAGGRASSTR